MTYWHTRAQWLQFPKDIVYKSDITWANIKNSAFADTQMKYCPGWAAPKQKGCPKKDTHKLGIVDHIQQGVAKRRRINPIVPNTIVEEVDKDDPDIGQYEELKLEDTMDGVIGMAQAVIVQVLLIELGFLLS